MIAKAIVLLIHDQLIKAHGGSNGIRDINGLESAIERPYQTFDGDELYTTSFEKAAAIGESIIMNHPFIDGNKRTGYVLMETLLRIEGYKIITNDEMLYELVINISTGTIHFDEIVQWLKINTAKA